MDNLTKIERLSKKFHLLLSLLLAVIPLYYVLYWALINHLPEKLITVNTSAPPLAPYELPIRLQVLGLLASLLPQSALIYGLVNLRKLFAFYREGILFSFEHVSILRSTSKALVLWVLFSMLYESSKSILFSVGAPPGSRVVEVTFSTAEVTTLIVGGVALVIAWVMDEGRILTEERELTI